MNKKNINQINKCSQDIKNYTNDMALLGKQHAMVQGLKCQLGCGNYATERVADYAENAKEIELLVCESCLWSQYEQDFDFSSDKDGSC